MHKAVQTHAHTAVSIPRGWVLLALTTSSWALAALIWMTASQIFSLL